MLHRVDTARSNKRILLRTGVGGGRCFPLFDTLGTVTGRIMVVDPHLQHISKKYRAIISASPGHTLVYLDYSQFEPNIMASISNDSMLSQICGDGGDLYERLSIDLCGSAVYRDTVKMMFLAYSYGKDVNSLSDFLADCDMSLERATAVIKQRFIPLFLGIEKWKASVEGLLFDQGRIGTLLGNHRYREVDGDLNARERRWAISQLVQGTGSLILKKVIIAVKQQLPEVSILLPMHDALLVEVPNAHAADVTEQLIVCFGQMFLNVCPSVTPSVKVKPFALVESEIGLEEQGIDSGQCCQTWREVLESDLPH